MLSLKQDQNQPYRSCFKESIVVSGSFCIESGDRNDYTSEKPKLAEEME